VRTRTVCATVVLGLVVIVAGVSLGEEVKGSGEGILVGSPPAEMQLPGGETYVQLDNRQVLMATDPSHPFHRVAITCSGSCRGAESGSCAGGCTGQDPDGDVINFTWNGQSKGEWTLVGGTGKWQGATGSGTWEDMGPLGAGFTRNAWSGTIQMP